MEFLQEVKLDRVGAFSYSQEDNTPAGKMANQITNNSKIKRLNKLMELQYQILLEKHRQYIGKEITVQVDGIAEDNNDLWVCRSTGEAPEIDPVILVFTQDRLIPGQLLTVKITHLQDYDLIGEIYCELT